MLFFLLGILLGFCEALFSIDLLWEHELLSEQFVIIMLVFNIIMHVLENGSFLLIVKQFQGSSMARDMLKLDAESIEFTLSRMKGSLVRKFHVVENGRLSLS